jgi:predicted phage tail protein
MQIIAVHATTIEIRWVAGFDGGVDQTFVLEYRLSKATSWNTFNLNLIGLEEDPQYFELSGLSSGVYDIQMYARNTIGNSTKTDIISVSTAIISESTTITSESTTIISVLGICYSLIMFIT